jgi:hypothetical protein
MSAYVVNHAMRSLLIPGQIENWISIVDTRGVGITQIPKEVWEITLETENNCDVYVGQFQSQVIQALCCQRFPRFESHLGHHENSARFVDAGEDCYQRRRLLGDPQISGS